MLRAFDRNSRLEVMMAFSARIFAPFLKQQPTTWLKDQNFGSLYSAEVWSPCYLSSHRSVNTTGTQLYPPPSLRKRPRGGNTDECGSAMITSSRASFDSN